MYKFDPIYWNTACLITNSGSNETSSDYSKIAKAISASIESGIKISLPDVNTSAFGFKPDIINNQILYGLKGMTNVGDDLIETIINNRPYISIKDFYERVKPNKQAMVALIKGGAFDNLEERKFAMAWYIWTTCNKKQRITLQNMSGLIKHGLLPEENDEQVQARRIYEFNRYLKSVCKSNIANTYLLDERAITFIVEIEKTECIREINGRQYLDMKAWDKFYQSWMDVFRNWISSNKAKILYALNKNIFLEDWNKYASGNYSSWEMEALCFYYHQHELLDINAAKYGIVNFFNLPEKPIVDKVFTKNGKEIRMFKLFKICGTCIAKNKSKHMVTLLTTNGVVDIKFNKEYFSLYDKQISQRGADGVKHVIEKSFFNRGNMLVVMGIRIDDTFIVKKYASSVGHQLYHIDQILPNGDLILRNQRYQGDAEDSE